MNYEEIKQKIEKRNLEIENSLNTPNQRLEFYEKFQKNNQFDRLRNIAKVNFSDLLLAHLGAHYKEEDFSYLKEKVDAIRTFVDRSSPQLFESLFKSIAFHVEETPFPGDLEEQKEKVISSMTKKTFLVPNNSQKANDIVSATILFEKYFDEMKEITDTIVTCKIIKEEIIRLDFHKKRVEKRFDYYEEKFLNEFLNDIDYKKHVSFINKYVKDLKEISKLERRKLVRELNDNKTFLDLFETALNKPLITNYRQIMSFLHDEDLIKNCLKIINEHNIKEYNHVDQIYTELCNDLKIKYSILLSENDIYESDYDLNSIMKNSYEDLDKMLIFLNKWDLSKENKIKVLENSKLQALESIDSYVMNGILTNDFVKDNIEILLSDSTKYNFLQENIQLLIEKNINPANFIQSQNTLLTDSILVKNNIKVLEDYDYLKSMKGIQKYDYLSNDNLPILIDKYIELGLENMLEVHIDLLNEDKVDRLVLLKQLNLLDITNYSKIKEILVGNFDIVPDRELNNYLYRNNDVDIETLYNYDYSVDLDFLKEYEISNRAYQINGNILSKNRVKRNYLLNDNNSIKKNLLLHSIYEGQPDKIKIKRA